MNAWRKRPSDDALDDLGGSDGMTLQKKHGMSKLVVFEQSIPGPSRSYNSCLNFLVEIQSGKMKFNSERNLLPHLNSRCNVYKKKR